jgi:hypothetical protein
MIEDEEENDINLFQFRYPKYQYDDIVKKLEDKTDDELIKLLQKITEINPFLFETTVFYIVKRIFKKSTYSGTSTLQYARQNFK